MIEAKRSEFPLAMELCRGWAEVQMRNGPLADPGARGGQGAWGYDLALVRATYVETTMWFSCARPILAHLFVKGQDLASYPFRGWIEQPADPRRHRPDLPRFERYAESLLRHGLLVSYWEHRPASHAAEACLHRFLCELEERAKCDPAPELCAPPRLEEVA